MRIAPSKNFLYWALLLPMWPHLMLTVGWWLPRAQRPHFPCRLELWRYAQGDRFPLNVRKHLLPITIAHRGVDVLRASELARRCLLGRRLQDKLLRGRSYPWWKSKAPSGSESPSWTASPRCSFLGEIRAKGQGLRSLLATSFRTLSIKSSVFKTFYFFNISHCKKYILHCDPVLPCV